nr:hypothetical protein GCM10020093_097290 [Planobispora longispora]
MGPSQGSGVATIGQSSRWCDRPGGTDRAGLHVTILDGPWEPPPLSEGRIHAVTIEAHRRWGLEDTPDRYRQPDVEMVRTRMSPETPSLTAPTECGPFGGDGFGETTVALTPHGARRGTTMCG